MRRLDVRTFCQITFCDNILVLFDLFDFNELNSLALINIEFMISSCLKSTFKIHKIVSEFDDLKIREIIFENFKDEKRINIT